MKKSTFSNANSDATVDMTPMLDIVFIMLIFFIVTTAFVRESALDVLRPTQLKNTIVDQGISLMIKLDENGTPFINHRQIDMPRLVANTQLFLSEHNTDTAVVQAHAKTRHGKVVAVIDAIKQAGIGRVKVLVE